MLRGVRTAGKPHRIAPRRLPLLVLLRNARCAGVARMRTVAAPCEVRRLPLLVRRRRASARRACSPTPWPRTFGACAWASCCCPRPRRGQGRRVWTPTAAATAPPPPPPPPRTAAACATGRRMCMTRARLRRGWAARWRRSCRPCSGCAPACGAPGLLVFRPARTRRNSARLPRRHPKVSSTTARSTSQ